MTTRSTSNAMAGLTSSRLVAGDDAAVYHFGQLTDLHFAPVDSRTSNILERTGLSGTFGIEELEQRSPGADDVDVTPSINLTVFPEGTITGLEKWEGRIVDIAAETFTAEIAPAGGGAPVLADFKLELLGPDRSAAGNGDLVYVTARTVRSRNGYPSTTASVRLRRLGRWTEEEQRRIRDSARERYETLVNFFD
jgi:hypothetical protein